MTSEGVDRRGKTFRRREQPLSAASINKTLTRLGQILDVADEYGMIQRNPLRVNPRNRKLKAPKPTAVWLDRADQIEALLAAAAELDARARLDRRHVSRKAMIGTLVFGGLRIGELVALRWRDVDLAAGRLWVREAKTDAGVRHVELLPGLREILTAHKIGCANTDPNALVFATRTGGAFSRDNVRNRVFEPALELANAQRVEAGLTPLPERLTMHKLRHTCCSLLFVCGYELPKVMAMLGHADKDVTLRIYAHASDAGEPERRALRELVGQVSAAQTAAHSDADVWAAMGSSGAGSSVSGEPQAT